MTRRKIIDKIGVGVVKVNNVNNGNVSERVAKHVPRLGCSLVHGIPPERPGVEDATEVW